tara:strand:- start:1317 stop:1859 length:543 start_codon:yes stop_codon:yes gene_type:complete
MSWKEEIKKKKYSYKRRKYPTTAQKKNKKLNRLNPEERQKKEEEMREYSRQQQHMGKWRKTNEMVKQARKPFEDKINNLKKEKEDIKETVIDMFVCSKGHKIYLDRYFFDRLLEARNKRNLDLTLSFCPECREKLDYDEEKKKFLIDSQLDLVRKDTEIIQLQRQAIEAEKKIRMQRQYA